MPVLAQLGMTVLPPSLRADVERLPALDELEAAAVREQVRLMARLMLPTGTTTGPTER